MDNIIEGNKLIAVFDGWKYIEDGDSFYKSTNLLFSNEIQYHSSWDWLMPVVEKINHLRPHFGFFINNQFTGVHGTTWGGASVSETIVKIETKDNKLIDSVWLAVVEFIKWYNKNKQ